MFFFFLSFLLQVNDAVKVEVLSKSKRTDQPDPVRPGPVQPHSSPAFVSAPVSFHSTPILSTRDFNWPSSFLIRIDIFDSFQNASVQFTFHALLIRILTLSSENNKTSLSSLARSLVCLLITMARPVMTERANFLGQIARFYSSRLPFLLSFYHNKYLGACTFKYWLTDTFVTK